MNRATKILAALAASTLALAACGGDDDAADDTTTTVAPETTAEATTTVAETTTTAAPETTTTAAPETTTTAAPETTTTEAPAPTSPNLVEVATEAGDFTLLLTAAEAAGLTETLETRDLTLLAPTDEAITALGDDALQALLADTEALTELLMNHLLPLPQTAQQIGLFNNVLAMGGASWPVSMTDGALTIGDANVIAENIEASNGFIQVLDAVLVPPAPTE